MLRLLSRFLRALFQFSKRAAGEATKFGRSGVKLLGVVGAARLECGEPAAESGELIRWQLGNSFGDFFDFHGGPALSIGWTGDAGSGVASRECSGHPSGRSPSQQRTMPEPPHSGHGYTPNPSAM
jgi:hypothetical protein